MVEKCQRFQKVSCWLLRWKESCEAYLISECFRKVTHVPSCNLQNSTASLAEATTHSFVAVKIPFLLSTQLRSGRSPDLSDKPISSCCRSPPLSLSRCHSAFSSLCVCDQSGAHRHSVVQGRCGFSPQTSSRGVRALSCHVISRPVGRWRGRWHEGRRGSNWVNSCNPWVGCGWGFVKEGC